MAIPSEFPFLYHGKEIIIHSNCILDSVANLLVRHMVFVGNVQKSYVPSVPENGHRETEQTRSTRRLIRKNTVCLQEIIFEIESK